MSDAEWIEWQAGACPVSGETLVDVRHKDGTFSMEVHAGDAVYLHERCGFDWWYHLDSNGTDEGFIVAYRVVKQ